MKRLDELILHIGCPKTGTTTLQRVLHRSRDALKREGVITPPTYLNNGNALVLGNVIFKGSYCASRMERLGLSSKQADRIANDHWSLFENDIRSGNYKYGIISSEHFFRKFDPDAFEIALEKFSRIAAKVRVFCYLRSPSDQFLSTVQERLKHPTRSLNFVSRSPNAKVLKHWAENFAWPVERFVFEKSRLSDGDIVVDFFQRALPHMDVGRLARIKNNINVSTSAEAMAVLFDLRKKPLLAKLNSRRFAETVRREDKSLSNPTKPVLSTESQKKLVNWFEPELEWLRTEHGIMFSSVDYNCLTEPVQMLDSPVPNRIEDICAVDKNRKRRLFLKSLLTYGLKDRYR